MKLPKFSKNDIKEIERTEAKNGGYASADYVKK